MPYYTQDNTPLGVNFRVGIPKTRGAHIIQREIWLWKDLDIFIDARICVCTLSAVEKITTLDYYRSIIRKFIRGGVVCYLECYWYTVVSSSDMPRQRKRKDP